MSRHVTGVWIQILVPSAALAASEEPIQTLKMSPWTDDPARAYANVSCETRAKVLREVDEKRIVALQ